MVELSPIGRRSLLWLARASVEEVIRGDGSLEEAISRTPIPEELHEARGVFVSLKLPSPRSAAGPRLRGCIGNLASVEPLYRNVIEVAARAARDDPRFPPLTAQELLLVRVEVSVLGPLTRLARPEELRIGRDGLQLKQGEASAVFLPQVACERGWSVGELLEQLALKAGLVREGWIGGELSVFEAEIFGDP